MAGADQIIVRFGQAGMAELEASIVSLQAKLTALQVVALKITAMPPKGVYGSRTGITQRYRQESSALVESFGESWAMQKNLLQLEKTMHSIGNDVGMQWQISQLAKNAQAANIPLFQMSRNAQRLAEVSNPLRNNLANLRLTVGAMAVDMQNSALAGERFARMAAAAAIPAGQLSHNAARISALRSPLMSMGGGAYGAMAGEMTAGQDILPGIMVNSEKRISALNDQIKKASAHTVTWSSATKNVGSALRGVGNAVEHASRQMVYYGFVAGGLAYSLFNAAKQMGEFGGKSLVTGQQFENTASKIGSMSSSLLPALEKATLGTVSKFDLMRLSNFALLTGLELTEPELLKLAEAAVKLGTAMGRDPAEAFQRLVYGITKGERRILDELGIIIQSKDIFKDYAAEIGSATDELDRHQKIQAYKGFVLENVSGKLKEMEGINWDLAASGQQVTKQFVDFGAAMSKLFVESGAAAKLSEVIKTALDAMLQRFSGEEGKRFFLDIVDAIRQLIPLAVKLAEVLLWAAKNAQKLAGAFIGKEMGGALGSFFSGIPVVGPAIEQGVKWAGTGAGWLMGSLMDNKETSRAVVEAVGPVFDQSRMRQDEMVRYINNALMNGPVPSLIGEA